MRLCGWRVANLVWKERRRDLSTPPSPNQAFYLAHEHPPAYSVLCSGFAGRPDRSHRQPDCVARAGDAAALYVGHGSQHRHAPESF